MKRTATLLHDLAALLTALAEPRQNGAHLRLDSRTVQPGDIFVAVAGRNRHGRDFIAAALAAGAVALLIDSDSDADLSSLSRLSNDHTQASTVPIFALAKLREQLGELAHRWYGEPSTALTVLAVTGTNGKTSCVQWLAAALNAGGVRCGTIGTLGWEDADDTATLTAPLTTPDVLTLHRLLAQWRDAGAQAVALEASSIGLVQGRLDGVRIAVAAYTNLSHDHLDYHGDMVAYAAAKRILFDWPGLRIAVINADDASTARVLVAIPQVPRRLGFSLDASSSAAIRAVALRNEPTGLAFTLATPTGSADVHTTLIGQHNAANLLLVAGVLQALGWSPPHIAAALSRAMPVPGRLETVVAADLVTPAAPDTPDASAPLPRIVVDYAHTPDALARTLAALRPLAQARGGKLICVFGCGGERDATKRPLMGAIALAHAEAVIVTSDNPRGEPPQTIIDQIVAGMVSQTDAADAPPRYTVILDRAQAILHAIWSAAPHDVVLIAGKGHETYQDIAGHKHYFDDRQWARAALALMPVPRVCTDTRRLKPGEVFLALVGERYDGHNYLAQAHAAQARAAIVAQRIAHADIAQIVLGDTRAALARLARAWRAQHTPALIAVTGSNGKTTTKEMIAAILATWLGADARLASPGNFNNDIGVPLALLQLRPQHRAAVLELGMNHPNEIAALAAIAAPTVALVNNAQREHLEFMQSVTAVARENGSVLAALPADGTAVYPAGDAYSALWDELSGARLQLRFGFDDDATIRASDITTAETHTDCRIHTPENQAKLRLPLAGRHNLHNALAAIACTHALGVPLASALTALASFAPVKGRMQHIALADGRTLIDDTYNANPDSVRAAIDVLARLPAPRVLVLGDMGEVGDDGPQLHHEVGAYARACGIGALYTMGEAVRYACEGYAREGYGYVEGFPGYVCQHDDVVPLVAELIARQPQPASILIKGSRSMQMERVVAAYLQAIQPQSTGAAHAA